MAKMKRKLAAMGLAVLLAAPVARFFGPATTAYAADAVQTPALNTLSDDEKAAGWKLLFDGKTTDGWRNFRKQTIGPGWKVIDGALTRAANGAGDIVTADQYEAFELVLDYRISKGGNSGVMFHVTEDEGSPFVTGPEIQVQDNQNWHDPELSGWLYQFYKPPTDPKTGKPVDATKPLGEWNQLRIIVSPQKSETYMNGVKYYEYVIGSDDWNQRLARSKFANWQKFGKAPKGYIDLQDHGNEVAFRNIKIRVLPAR